jgi:hypothetical protein
MTKVEDEETPIPLTTSKFADDLKWSTRNLRKVLKSLNLCASGLPQVVKVANKSWRIIFFDPLKLNKRFKEFVTNYKPEESANSFFELIKPKKAQEVLPVQPKKVTQVTQVTDTTHNDISLKNIVHNDNSIKENQLRVGSVTSVTSVTEDSKGPITLKSKMPNFSELFKKE